MGGLFGVGSICFALGSTPLYFNHLQPAAVATTFFVGSLFFTVASAVQYHEARGTPSGTGPGTPTTRGLRTLRRNARRADWWAAAVQLVGTIFFNVTTFAATRTDLTLHQERHLIWAPDVFGSICFLVASWLAYSEVNPTIRPHSDGSTGWRIAALNLAGSIAFGAAAIAGRYIRTTGDIANIRLVNFGTLLGALCFLAGAILLPVASAREAAADD